MTLFRRSASQRARDRKPKGRFVAPSAATVTAVSDVLVRLVGETVKGRIARAALIGGIAAAANFATPEPPVQIATPPAQVAPAPVQVEHVTSP